MKQLDDLADGRLAFVVRLTPRASNNQIVGWSTDGQLRIRVTAAPVDDAANQELVKILSKHLDVAKGRIVITSGSRSRTKILAVPQSCKNQLLRIVDIC